MPKLLSTVLIGSRAHGLERIDSDSDYRSVYGLSFSELSFQELTGSKIRFEGGKNYPGDYSEYEVGHFLKYCLKGNPSMLEVFRGPVVEETDMGKELRGLLPYVWDSERVVTSVFGYSKNQINKLTEDPESRRAAKYGVAALRSLIWGRELLIEGDFTLEVSSSDRQMLLNIRDGYFTVPDIMYEYMRLRGLLKEAELNEPKHESDVNYIVKWLVDIRHIAEIGV